jgi:hypothetical protein
VDAIARENIRRLQGRSVRTSGFLKSAVAFHVNESDRVKEDTKEETTMVERNPNRESAI